MQKRLEGFYRLFILPLLRHKVFKLVLLLAALTVLFSFWSVSVGNNFFKISTLKNIMNSLVVTSFLTIGAGCLLMSGNIDLSASAVGAFGSMVLALSLRQYQLPWWLSIIVALLACAVFGVVNGVLINRFRFPAFIATLAMAFVARGMMFFVSSGGTDAAAVNVNFASDPIKYIGKGEPIPGVQLGVIIMLVFFIAYGIVINLTKYGLNITLVGGNPRAARLTGIKPDRTILMLYINSAVLSGIAGTFTAARVSQGNLNALQTNQFTGLTAAILGGISFGGGSGGMGGAFVGLLILNTFQIGMTTIGVSTYWITVFTGVILLLALSFDFFEQQQKNKAVMRGISVGGN